MTAEFILSQNILFTDRKCACALTFVYTETRGLCRDLHWLSRNLTGRETCQSLVEVHNVWNNPGTGEWQEPGHLV